MKQEPVPVVLTLGSTPTYRAPSVILADFLKLWPAMQSVESKIQAISS